MLSVNQSPFALATLFSLLLLSSPASLAGDPADSATQTATSEAAATIDEDDEFGADWPLGPGREDTGYLCGACHSLAIVKQQGLKREDWDELLDWMVEEQGMDEPEAADRVLILDYLAKHFNVDRKLK